MRHVSDQSCRIRQLASILGKLGTDAWRFLVLCLQPAPALAAELLFWRKRSAKCYEDDIVSRMLALQTV